MRVRVLLSLLALLATGCAGPAEPAPDGDPALQRDGIGGVVFGAERSQYRHGDTATIVLRNNTSEPLSYNLCISARELQIEGSWVRFEPLRLCAAALFTLHPGAETALREPITSEWQAGEYRMVTRVGRMGAVASDEVFTPAFAVAD